MQTVTRKFCCDTQRSLWPASYSLPLRRLGRTVFVGSSMRYSEQVVASLANTIALPPHKAAHVLKLASRDESPADHRDIGTRQKLFIASPFSPGSPLFTPSGTLIFQRIVSFLQAQNQDPLYQEVITPTIYKKTLWEQSGHWQVYKDAMFEVRPRQDPGESSESITHEDNEYGLKPMNCPGHCLLFDSEPRSYKQLPIRYSEFGALHRNELSGTLSGLTRVRKFHQDDGHVFCQPSQIESEINTMLNSLSMIYKTFQLPAPRFVLSTKPEKDFIGSLEDWKSAEEALVGALTTSGNIWSVNEGDGAFYGPKIDISLKDSDGKEHQTGTIQLDFQLPRRFELTYQVPVAEVDGGTANAPEDIGQQAVETKPRPVLIHRAIIGSVERFMAVLSENNRGRWPFWLSPRQVQILVVHHEDNLRLAAYVKSLKSEMSGSYNSGADWQGLHQVTSDKIICEVNRENEKMGKKLLRSKMDFWSISVAIGPREVEAETVVADFESLPVASQEAVRLCVNAEPGTNLRHVTMSRDRFMSVLDYLRRRFL
ncbi:MAG: hypothetical protein M1814_000837 [Vezdaea aestivalis]|nr:MAG: hypothetical protein M1814_000837 [Vezdaea aestivalis]